MKVEGKRKFIGALVTLGIFLLITSFVILAMILNVNTMWDNPTLTGLGIFCGALGAGLTTIAGFFFIGNSLEHFSNNKKSNDSNQP